MNRLLALFAPVALIALLLGLWEGACRALNVPVFLLPAPSAIGAALVADAPTLFLSGWNTLSMALSALTLAALVAWPLALVAALSPSLERAVRPLAVTLQVTPVVAIAPLVVIWAGLDHPSGPSPYWRPSSPSSRCSPGRSRGSSPPTRTWSVCSTSMAPRGCSGSSACAFPRPRPSFWRG